MKPTFNRQPEKVDLEEPAQEMQGQRGGVKNVKLLAGLLKETCWKWLRYSTLFYTPCFALCVLHYLLCTIYSPLLILHYLFHTIYSVLSILHYSFCTTFIQLFCTN